ncbi:MAG: DUF885 family protein, partial [Deltaproteobacteria bacterium]
MRAAIIVIALGLAGPAASLPPASAADPHAALRALFQAQWDWAEAAYPEQATENGDERFNDRLTDWSPEAIAAREAHERALLARVKAFDRRGLSEQERLDLDLFLYPLQQEIDGYGFHDELLPLNQIDSPPGALAELARAVPRERLRDYEDYLARLRAIPTYIDQQVALLDRGLALGVTPPKVVLEKAPAQLRNHLVAPEENPLYTAVFGKAMPASIPPAEQARLRREAALLLRDQVIPAYRK